MGKVVSGVYLVSAVLDGGPAQKAGIQAGDSILSADGAPFTTSGSFHGKEGKKVQLTVKREGAAYSVLIDVVPVKQNQLRAFLNATRNSAHVINVQGKRIGYVHLWTMANDNFKNALDGIVINQLHDTDGLILDLRDGFGGIPFGYIDVFTRPDVSWESQYRGGQPSVTHTGYNKPIVVLINEGTRSAKEFFSYQFKSSHRALLVGKQTAGAFLGAGSFPISDTGLLEMAIVGLRIDGIKLEQDGVRPDVEVDAKDSYTDRDQQMKVATDRLIQQITKTAHPGTSGEITVH
jgi:carboxyl-terminal processing protease